MTVHKDSTGYRNNSGIQELDNRSGTDRDVLIAEGEQKNSKAHAASAHQQ